MRVAVLCVCVRVCMCERVHVCVLWSGGRPCECYGQIASSYMAAAHSGPDRYKHRTFSRCQRLRGAKEPKINRLNQLTSLTSCPFYLLLNINSARGSILNDNNVHCFNVNSMSGQTTVNKSCRNLHIIFSFSLPLYPHFSFVSPQQERIPPHP